MTSAHLLDESNTTDEAIARRRVRDGAIAFDEVHPTWFLPEAVDTTRLDMGDCRDCMVGQMLEHVLSPGEVADVRGHLGFSSQFEQLFDGTPYTALYPSDLGFDVGDAEVSYHDLREWWLEEIWVRRESA